MGNGLSKIKGRQTASGTARGGKGQSLSTSKVQACPPDALYSSACFQKSINQ